MMGEDWSLDSDGNRKRFRRSVSLIGDGNDRDDRGWTLLHVCARKGDYKEVPKVDKIVVNCGIGEAAQNIKGLDAAINDMTLITGQRPVKTKARNAIAQFKIRENQTLGIAVTLRGNLSYDALGKPKGMDVCITTTAQTDKEAYKLLALMGMPFREGAGPVGVVKKKKLKSHHFNTKTKAKSRR